VLNGCERHPARVLTIGVCEVIPGIWTKARELLVAVKGRTALELPGWGDAVEDIAHLVAGVHLPCRAEVSVHLLFNWFPDLGRVCGLWV
jgi:hypothetical protein